MKDPDSRLRSEFTGDIPHFQPSVEWVLPERFTPFDDLELSIQDTVAKKVIQVIPAIGRIEFDHQGDRYSLEVADVHGAPVIFFADATSGRETYGTGRVLELASADAGRITTIDFNRVYNFPCSFTYCTCPIAKPANRLPFPVTAGEKKPLETAYEK